MKEPRELFKTLDVIFFRPAFVDLVNGNIKASLLLSQSLHWQLHGKTRPDGFWYKTYEKWYEEIRLSRSELDRAREDCSKFLQTERSGMPPKLWYRVNLELLALNLFEIDNSELSKIDYTCSRKQATRAVEKEQSLVVHEDNHEDKEEPKADDSSIQLVKSFEASFSHYKKHRTIKELRRELEAAGHLLKVLPAPDVISLAQRCAADPFTGRRGFVANLQTMLAKLEALQAVYGVTQAPAEYEFKAEDGWMQDPDTGTRFRLPPPNKTYRQYREEWDRYAEGCRARGEEPNLEWWTEPPADGNWDVPIP